MLAKTSLTLNSMILKGYTAFTDTLRADCTAMVTLALIL